MTELRLESFGYHTIEPIDLSLRSGDCISVSEPSGSGKSFLLRAVPELDTHTGEIYLKNDAASERPAHIWRRRVGLLPAESAWWNDYVGDHFSVSDDRWMAALGFDMAAMTWEISRISSGERQRLSLIRLLSGKPEVLLLDEPTANLDPDNVACVESLIHKAVQIDYLIKRTSGPTGRFYINRSINPAVFSGETPKSG